MNYEVLLVFSSLVPDSISHTSSDITTYGDEEGGVEMMMGRHTHNYLVSGVEI